MNYIGIMSGTSLDGIDAVLCNFDNNDKLTVLAKCSIPFDRGLQADLQQLLRTFTLHLKEFGELEVRLAYDYAKAVKLLLKSANLNHNEITAIGCHGQTIFHEPIGKYPFSLQLLDGNKLAQLTGINVVCDFRRMDMAYGGQGAPLTPVFHKYFLSGTKPRVILNLGGIANITMLDPASENVTGFDTGPANCLIDLWVQDRFGLPYDKDGVLAKSGTVIAELLEIMLKDEYFQLPAPKSTGKEIYHLDWIKAKLAQATAQYSDEDVLCTLTELTAQTVADAIASQISTSSVEAIYACGGGAFNGFLLERISHNSGIQVTTTKELGIDVDQLEAIAFAWFAKRRVEKKPANYESVTGASQKCILGALYEVR
ncbi:anhydro-N-acetylmuramic acid kinase [Aquella oligotrophica]|uniref:Anhydro-N-acetylmuramic acid kinase n=1 Tax=Aquella oligotrophica TaxID=2067065 RepID=A0A2I7N6X4_9NEIS|nr:anhydro-N-acetylmuramic acid kinase [Aquella oligotrophica]AUR52226.1 anhydro-N-acetylmuramic acid kinase [Aquella oligotrophica]